MMLLSIGNSDAQCVDFAGSKDCFVVCGKSRLFFKQKPDSVSEVLARNRVHAAGSDLFRCKTREIAAFTAGRCPLQ